MKKFLIASTALVAAGLMSSGAQAADPVKLELSGSAKWFVVGAWQDEVGNQSFNDVDVKGIANIDFSGSTKLDNGLEVGVFTGINAGTNTGANGGDVNNIIDIAYVYVASSYGKVIMGVLQNGTHLLHVQAPEAIGQWNDDGLLSDNNIIAAPGGILSINANGVNSTSILAAGESEGITYVSPTFSGFTIGGSYIPNDDKNNRGPVNTNDAAGIGAGGIHEIYGIGVNYTNSFDGFGVKASLGWVTADFGDGITGTASAQDIDFYNGGLSLSYAGFTLGGSYRVNDHQSSVANVGVGGNNVSLDGYAYDVGLQYASGPWATSVTYYGSEVDGSNAGGGNDEEVEFIQASLNYDIGPGVSLQGLVGYGSYEVSTVGPVRTAGEENDGWTALTGVAIQF